MNVPICTDSGFHRCGAAKSSAVAVWSALNTSPTRVAVVTTTMRERRAPERLTNSSSGPVPQVRFSLPPMTRSRPLPTP